jgi:membrane-associated phospholipid phosphatase
MKSRWIKLIALFFILVYQISFSQNLFRTIASDAKVFSKNLSGYFTAPLHFKSVDISRTMFVATGTVLLFGFDHLNKNFQKFDDKMFSSLMKIDNYYGTVWMLGLVGGLLYGGGLLFEDDRVREMGVMVFESGLFSGAVTSILKFSFGRERPYVSGNKFKFHPFSFSGNKFYSLPSGHATLSFAVSTVLASRFENTFVKILIYTPAVLTALARVYNNQHWFSDVFLGSAIGYFSGVYIVNAHKRIN